MGMDIDNKGYGYGYALWAIEASEQKYLISHVLLGPLQAGIGKNQLVFLVFNLFSFQSNAVRCARPCLALVGVSEPQFFSSARTSCINTTK